MPTGPLRTFAIHGVPKSRLATARHCAGPSPRPGSGTLAHPSNHSRAVVGRPWAGATSQFGTASHRAQTTIGDIHSQTLQSRSLHRHASRRAYQISYVL